MGTKEPDNLFFGITNPDFAPNMETLGLLAETVAEAVDCPRRGSIGDGESTFVAIFFKFVSYNLAMTKRISCAIAHSGYAQKSDNKSITYQKT